MSKKLKLERKTKKVMVLWEPSLYKRAKKFAKAKNTSISHITRIAVTELLDNYEN